MAHALSASTLAIAGVAGTGWYLVVPSLVKLRHPRAIKNADHFAKMVRFHRAWGLGAVILGVGIAWGAALPL